MIKILFIQTIANYALIKVFVSISKKTLEKYKNLNVSSLIQAIIQIYHAEFFLKIKKINISLQKLK